MKYNIKNILSVIMAGMSFCAVSQAQEEVTGIPNPEDTSVEVAYGTQPEWQVTGAISSVKGDELSNSFTSNVANTLYGRLPGLIMQQGHGEPGADQPTMLSRGKATFTGNSDMLVIIDGLPSSITFFQQLTPQEIETVSLLKDASARAIYGNRAANGVLMVTTKRGVVAPLELNFSIQYGIQQAPRLPDFLGSYDYARLYNEALQNDGEAPRYSQEALDAYRTGSNPQQYPNVNWYRQVLRDVAPMANYNFNTKGGSEDVRYFVLFNVLDNRGLYKRTEKETEFTKNQSYIRYNFRTNIDIQLSKRLSMVANLGGTVEDKTNPGVDETAENVLRNAAAIPPNAFPASVNGSPGGSAMYSNPWADISRRGYVSYNGRAAQASARLIGDLGMITPGLSISGVVGFNSYFKSFSKKSREYARYGMDGTKYGENTSYSGNERDAYQWRNYVLQGFLNYERTFGVHGVDAMLMANYDDYSQTNNYNDSSRSSVLPYKSAGMGGRVTYAFDKRYIAEFSFGYTGDDNLLRGKRFGFFPAASLGWVLSNESFLKNNSIVDFLKLRGSYGLTGNSDTGGSRFPYNQYYNWAGYNLGTSNMGVDGLVQGTLANPDATWEKDKMWNIGVDATLIRNLSFSFDYFHQKRYDILAYPAGTVPDFFGGSVPYMNVGEVENKGFEAVVRYDGKSKEVEWFVEASGWFARNKILYSAEEPRLYDYLYRIGNRINQPFGLVAIGFFQDEEDIANSPVQTFADVQPGDIKYKDMNNDGVIDDNDQCPIGYNNYPELTMGFHAGVTYKGFDLDLFFQGAVNRSVYWDGKYYQAFQDNGSASSVALGRWTKETAASATYPRLSASDNQNNYAYSSFWMKNGNFLKLRSLELGYTLPKELTQKISIQKARVFFNGTNLFSIDNMEGMMDPESISGGIGYPVMRTFSLGLHIQL
ncbi:MAG: TonB-dependent receptor [Candidatus Azobacteroides sp.]|nr:TonB-dependent receptor [Candidatus Azobacteroides sp.]